MSVGGDFRTVLLGTGLTVSKKKTTSTASVYITYNYTTLPDLHADNKARAERYLLSAKLVAPITYNTTVYEAQIKSLLEAAGYPYPQTFETSDDPNEQNIVFETEATVGIGG